MNFNLFGFHLEKPASQFDFLWLPLLLPVVFFLVDSYLVPQAFLLPLMLIMLLCYLALRLPAWAVAFWTLIYMGLVVLITLVPLEDTQTIPALKPFIRAAFLMAAGTSATLLALHRGRLQKGNQALFKVISHLPLAVIVSDLSGNILLMNTKAQEILQGRITELSGLSFFSAFSRPDEQGRMIAQYIGYFDHEQAGPVSTILHTRDATPLTLHVSISVVGLDKNRYAVTVIDKVEEISGKSLPKA